MNPFKALFVSCIIVLRAELVFFGSWSVEQQQAFWYGERVLVCIHLGTLMVVELYFLHNHAPFVVHSFGESVLVCGDQILVRRF